MALLTPTLHIEVLLNAVQAREKNVSFAGSAPAITRWIVDRFARLEVGQKLDGCPGLSEDVGARVEEVAVTAFTAAPEQVQEGFIDLDRCELDVKAYILCDAEHGSHRGRYFEGDDMPQLHVLPLPNLALHDEWDSLVFDDDLPAQLLRYLTRMIDITNSPELNMKRMNFNRTCLLHGPPGSGKSTLCKALVQKLAIRLSDRFPTSVLMQIDTNEMLSKYFGESGKLISSTFNRILDTARSTNSLVCVVLDEVETIAGARDKVTSSGDCNDSLRATNQLLTALDRLRDSQNVFVLCTSNLIEAIDPAFLDRMDINHFIRNPSARAIYEIFRSCLNELLRSGAISIDTASTESPSDRSCKTGAHEDAWLILEDVPEYAVMAERLSHFPDAAISRIWGLAQRSVGMSGRSLRRLPVLGLAMYTWGETCTLDMAVEALAAAVEQELAVASRMP